MSSAFSAELELLIRARYPLIYVVTAEELRLTELVAAVAERRGKRVFEWASSTGLIPGGTSVQSRKHHVAATRDPLAALDVILEQVEPALFVFKDLHPYLGRQHPQVVRRLKDIALHLKHSLKTLILVGPVLEVPVEIEKELTVLHLPLPGRADLGELLDRIVREVSELKHVEIDLDPSGRERLLQAALGLTLGEAENVFAKIVVSDARLSGDDVHAVFAEKQQIVRKSGLLEYYASEAHFGQVGGLNALKDWLTKRSAAFTPEARAFGLPAPRGVLLLGVQGCGKSLSAKAVSSLWQMPLLRFDMGRMFSGLVGSSEENIRRAISVAESVAPAVLGVDEIDKAFAGASAGGSGDGGTSARVFGTFLTWLSEKKSPVFVVATANDISHLPPELLRKGRLDEIFFVDLPTPTERAEILQVHLAKRGRNPEHYEIGVLADAAEDFSGAELEEAINSALYEAFHAGLEVSSAHIQEAVGATVPLARTMDEQIRRLRHWAEGRARRASQ
jgi:AAA+ superfamily predicted ATPase